ncbi:hypothetical protein BGZ81_001008, partial [Podila clonocystis]
TDKAKLDAEKDQLKKLLDLKEGTSNAFSVKIHTTETVDGLKKLIKAEKTTKFDDVAADELTLWRVSIPIDPVNKHNPVTVNEITFKTDRDPTDDLSDVFEEKLPKKNMHTIVQRPPCKCWRGLELVELSTLKLSF